MKRRGSAPNADGPSIGRKGFRRFFRGPFLGGFENFCTRETPSAPVTTRVIC